MFEGLQPDAETHKTFLNVEPYTGMTLNIHNRIQVENEEIQNLNLIRSILQLNTVLYNKDSLDIKGEFKVLENLNYFSTFPFLWLDLTASVTNVSSKIPKQKDLQLISNLLQDQEQVDKLKTELVTPLLLLDVFSWVIIGVGIALTLLGVVIFFCSKQTYVII